MINFSFDNLYTRMNILDNSKFEQLVKNRPPVSILPAINKRLVGQRLARTAYSVTIFGLMGSILLYKFWLNANSAPFLKSRKSYSFESDPYSGKVRCTYNEVPNYQHGY
jgi:hypothetical protein